MRNTMIAVAVGAVVLVSGAAGSAAIAETAVPGVTRLATEDVKHTDMGKALHKLRAARHALEQAPKDYEGHRAAAIALTTDAIKEVEAGLKANNELPENPPSANAPTTKPAKEVDKKAGDKLLETAHKDLKAAVEDLQKADKKYGVHRETALDLTQQALKEVHQALTAK